MRPDNRDSMSGLMSGLFCWNCGNPGNTSMHYCFHCHGKHHFITYEQLDKIRYGYAVDRQMPEPPLDAELKPEHFEVPLPEPEEVSEQERPDNRSSFPVPQITRDKQHKYYDWTCGQTITARSQKRKIFKDLGLIEVSAKDAYRDKEKYNVTGRAITYGGQRHHKSSAEKGGARTATGQRVI